MSALTRGEKFSYGVGNVGLQGVGALVTFFLLFYYTDVVGVPAGTAASALLVAKIWDIVNDPLFGWVSDRTRSRFGRRRIYLIAGAVPLGVVTFALFSLPTGLSGAGAFVAVVASFLLFDTLFTLVNVPYSAMSAELTHDYDERTSLLTYSSIGAVVGFLLGGALAGTASGGWMLAHAASAVNPSSSRLASAAAAGEEPIARGNRKLRPSSVAVRPLLVPAALK